MTQTVPSPETPDQPTEKRAEQLAPGDWFEVPKLGTHAKTLSAHIGVNQVLVVFQGDAGGPEVTRIPVGLWVRLLTPAEIEREKEAAYRFSIAEDLRRLADLMLSVDAIGPRSRGLKLSTYLDSLDQVTAISKALDIEVAVDSAGKHAVCWPKGHKSYERGVHVEWFVYVEKEPEPAPAAEAVAEKAATPTGTGLDFSREPDAITASPVPKGVDGRPVGKRTPAKAVRTT